ncbi:MAG: ABC transporter permease [Deltaproteobacteria bacterium]|nr:ABC transporter permease [Deltaproteobacteria bacterium]NTV58917.1 ABC transporter permease [Deltaproteobacteria bacterium]
MGRGHYTLAYLLAALIMMYVSYSLPRWLPGDFVTAMYSSSHVTLNAEQEEGLRAFYTQRQGFGQYLVDFFTLQWGYSYAFLTPISKLIGEALPWSLLLLGTAHLLSMAFGFLAGVETAWRRGGVIEKAGVGSMAILEGIPEIGSGVILLLLFALHLGWLPAAGGETAYVTHSAGQRISDVARHLVLPFATLFLAYLPGNFLLTRGSMVMVLKEQFIETARAKGLPPLRIRYAHAARNALLPMVTRFGLRIAFMLTGALVVETIYAYPGLGTLLFNAIAMRDLPLIQGIVLFSSLLVLFVNLALDFLYGWIDPRVKYAS